MNKKIIQSFGKHRTDISQFQKTVWDFYHSEDNKNRHSLPWRKTKDPYKILVSEIMLQQTQVERVVPKYKEFLKAFPTVSSLAKASNVDVLKLWSGLGYNRRALFLKRAAEYVTTELAGKFPKTVEDLENLPGVGPYTARAIGTFAYNQPHAFIETNVRSLFLHHFFSTMEGVSDSAIMPLIERAQSLDRAREWGWALMDYGSYIKKNFPNPSKRSKHHTVQSKFEGSLRQVRGAYLKYLTQVPGPHAKVQVIKKFKREFGDRALPVFQALLAEGFITQDLRGYVKIS